MRSAFTLIELMVVIAIVAVLLAVAIPAYQNYITNARFATIIPVIENVVKKSIEYSQTHGRFGNAYDLGLSATPGSNTIDNPEALSPYMGGLALSSNFGLPQIDDVSGGSCVGARGSFMGVLDPRLLGFPPSVVDNADNLGFQCDYWNYEGIIDRVCFYVYGTTEYSQTAEIIPNWINMNTTNLWDCANVDIYLLSQDSYINAQCQ